MANSMSGVHSGPVVVGVDGSPSSHRAIELAVGQARRRHAPLHVVHGFIWPFLPSVPMAAPPVSPAQDELRRAAEQIVADAVARARALAADLDVSGEVITGTASAVLIEASRPASMVVVGDRGLGGFTGMLVGSVALQVVSHAASPVLVARGRPSPTGPVLLGTDGCAESEPAVGFAFEEAAFRGAPLLALHAWRHPLSAEAGDTLPLVYDVDDIAAEEERVVSEALAGWCERYPEVEVRQDLVRGRTAHALLQASERCQLAVVGARGRGGFAGLLLGSVSQALVHHAACPVAIVRHHRETG